MHAGLRTSSQVPLYVTAIEPEGNRIIVAPAQESMRAAFFAVQFNWVSVEGQEKPRALTVKVRSSSRSLSAE